ncbi:hypothetical protein PTSG_02407 [Salpingoeca rosetta]|uniref:PDZ domain-containing protein n=1 Tax=Salpingoeca rosetta (strain ATCC 50818 / BSB-021) TaxID=946362 RepID=F2U242_SALR5|nr:uncharacterized protein PTSG_02407 [Salpingoeca rosetta]EGD81694.1 hypothetical protein PTSG_02407 [Salpingoeca rosetta]|eukprot:XP_004996898.1 hypothetical protein PTSG_02407 [Salpingoeca rosetta]
MSRFLFRRSKHAQQVKKAGGGEAAQPSIRDVNYQHLKQFRAEQGMRGQTEYFVDWGEARQRSEAQRDDFLQMRGPDGSWQDVRVVLHSTHLSILRLATEQQQDHIQRAHRRLEKPREVVIHKSPGETLGMSIKGGKEHRLPILLSQIREGGPVDFSKACFVGDEILEVNGVSIRHVTQDEAIDIIQATYPLSEVRLVLRFYLAAHHQLVSDYLRAPDTSPALYRQQKWQQVMAIPLEYCSVSYFQGHTAHRREQESFLVQAALDVNKRAVLRPPFGRVEKMQEWVRAIRAARDNLPCQQMAKADPPLDFTGRVVHIGRVHERLTDGTWRDLFLVLTDHDIALHTSPPTQPSDLDHPRWGGFPLLATRLVKGTRKPTADDPLDARELEQGCFMLKVCGGLSFYLSAGSPEMALRLRVMIEKRTDAAVRTAGAITYSARHEWDVALTVNWQTGLWLNNDLPGDKSLIWHHPFAHLRTVEVRNANTLRFRFAETTAAILVDNPELVKFVITTFMACHLRSREETQVLSVA